MAVSDPLPEAQIEARAELTTDEKAAGSDDPKAQARAILEESEERILHRETDRDPAEHRHSEDTVDPT
jgi:hypothetical protein